MKDLKFIQKTLIIVAVLTLILPFEGLSRELEGVPASLQNGVPSSLQSPKDISDWLSREFSYRFELPDRWQDPEETLSSKAGDCEDFAILSSELLGRIGISNDIVIVKFRDLNISHAICIWKNPSGSYDFISDRRLHRSGQERIEDAVERYYPDWEKIIFVDQNKRLKKTLCRK